MKRKRATRFEVERARRDAIWRIATDAAVPASWADWFARKVPTLASVEWGAAPIDLRQGFARDLLSTSPSKEAPGGRCKSIRPSPLRPTGIPITHARDSRRGVSPLNPLS
jgi:hypothetical protein